MAEKIIITTKRDGNIEITDSAVTFYFINNEKATDSIQIPAHCIKEALNDFMLNKSTFGSSAKLHGSDYLTCLDAAKYNLTEEQYFSNREMVRTSSLSALSREDKIEILKIMDDKHPEFFQLLSPIQRECPAEFLYP